MKHLLARKLGRRYGGGPLAFAPGGRGVGLLGRGGAAGKRFAAAVAALIALAGCQMATGPTVQQSQGSMPPLTEDRGRIFIYRPYNYVGSAGSPILVFDQSPAGVAMLEGALYCDLAPGNHLIWGTQYVSQPVPVSVVAGQAAYLRIQPGWSGFDIIPVTAGDGAAEIASMHLVPATCPQEFASAAPEPVTSKPQIDETLASGSEAEERGDLAEALAIYTAALQKHVTRLNAVGDVVDRAIDVAARMRPPPPIPESARKHAAAAVEAIKGATTKTGFAVARRDYQNALAAAPWWADGWLNLSLVDGQIGTAADVRQDLVWYLRAAPDASDRDTVQKKIDDLSAKRREGAGTR